jgi:DNA-binding response OmpR family regulator
VAAIKVLLVDDEVIVSLLSEFLSQEGFEITTASSARETLKLITSHTYDVLLSELNMPDPGDGFTLVSASRHASPETVTILLSALPRMGAATRNP